MKGRGQSPISSFFRWLATCPVQIHFVILCTAQRSCPQICCTAQAWSALWCGAKGANTAPEHELRQMPAYRPTERQPPMLHCGSRSAFSVVTLAGPGSRRSTRMAKRIVCHPPKIRFASTGNSHDIDALRAELEAPIAPLLNSHGLDARFVTRFPMSSLNVCRAPSPATVTVVTRLRG